MSPVSQDSFSGRRESRGRRSGPARPRGPGAEEAAAGEHDGPVLALVAAAAASAGPAGLKVAGGDPGRSEPLPFGRKPQPSRRTGLKSGRPACPRVGEALEAESRVIGGLKSRAPWTAPLAAPPGTEPQGQRAAWVWGVCVRAAPGPPRPTSLGEKRFQQPLPE